MKQINIENFLSKNVSILNGVGSKIKSLLKKKKIEKISDLLWNFPQGYTDRTNLRKLDKLEVGKITTIKTKVLKYNFPRIRNLPSRVFCEDDRGKIDIIFFNSREGYIKKILPINKEVVISGKISFFRGKYQITNPSYVVPVENEKYVNKVIPKYSLTEGLTEKVYRKLIEQVLNKIKNLEEWHSKDILKRIGNVSWSQSIINLHENKSNDFNSNYYRRLAYDEILSNFIVLSHVRKRVKKYKKNKKLFDDKISKKIVKNFKFTLTDDQIRVTNEINNDLSSERKMFRILQGDVGSGKTIVSFIAASNVIRSNYQAAMMAPTEILAKQHYELAKKIFKFTNIKIELLTGKTLLNNKYSIQKKLSDGKINFLIGTHALFQKSLSFNKLGLIIIDEQHKFGVKQRIDLSRKGGNDCDILLMSATPIPRSLILAIYGDMDVSKLISKPINRKSIITLSKPDHKLNEVLNFIKKKITSGDQIFWVCPLIEESKILDYSSAIKKYLSLSKIFRNKVGIIHGNFKKNEKDKVLNLFLERKIDILVSTTVIEVGIDFPNANVIVIENSNKFGLAQLHQLRGRVGRGLNQGTCILLYKNNLSTNAKKRINILKTSNDGFYIAEQDMILRGFGDVLGYQQSGLKNFKIADPVHHEDLFKIAEENIKNIEFNEKNFNKFNPLLKLFDKAEIINQIKNEQN